MVLTYDAYSETIEEKQQRESEVKELREKYEQEMKTMREEMGDKFKQILAKIDVTTLIINRASLAYFLVFIKILVLND